MSGFLTSTWQIALSAIIPVAISVIFLVAETREPFASRIRAWHGMRALDLTSLSILFGLFAALLVSDVWRKANDAEQAVHEEGAAVRSIAHAARANGIEPVIIPRLKAYIAAASAEDPYSRKSASGRGRADTAYHELLTAIIKDGNLETGDDCLRLLPDHRGDLRRALRHRRARRARQDAQPGSRGPVAAILRRQRGFRSDGTARVPSDRKRVAPGISTSRAYSVISAGRNMP